MAKKGDRKIADALRAALEAEKQVVEMYEAAGERTTYPPARRMFLSLAADEKQHITMIQEISRGMGFSAALKQALAGTPRGRMKTALSEFKDTVGDLAVCADEVEAVRMALSAENTSYEFYKQAEAAASDSDEKALFARLAQEESEHHAMLRNVLDYLSDTGHWFLWTEQGLLDGG